MSSLYFTHKEWYYKKEVCRYQLELRRHREEAVKLEKEERKKQQWYVNYNGATLIVF